LERLAILLHNADSEPWLKSNAGFVSKLCDALRMLLVYPIPA